MAKLAKIPERAPAGPTTLNRLPPKNAATAPAQMAVMIPMMGDAPEAIASESESGTETSATVNADFQFAEIFRRACFMTAK